jgi:DNA topoisomerase-1
MDPIEMSDLKCEKCDDIYLLRDSLKGLFLAASQFPKNRETRAPLVSEIKSVIDKLPEKHQIFANAPELDPDGDNLVVRFNRKDGSHTLSAEAKGKKKKLFFVYEGSDWKEMQRD